MTTNIKTIIVSIVVIILTICFIFFQSTLQYNAMGRTSNSFAEIIYEVVYSIDGGAERSVSEIELIIRKLAHFMEYSVLGTVAFIGVMLCISKRPLAYFLIFLITLPIPFIDEMLIQSHVVGRSVSLLDIGIDLLGIFMAVGIGSLYFITMILVNTVNIQEKI